MKDWDKKNNKQKHQFQAKDYCVNCQQRKSCGLLDEKKKYCCSCYREILEELEEEGLLISETWKTLNDYRQGVIKCYCQEAEKPRVSHVNSDGSGWSKCKECEKFISGAGHHRTIRNRNDPQFWGLEVKEKVLCLECLGEFQGKMPVSKRYTFKKYVRRGYE